MKRLRAFAIGLLLLNGCALMAGEGPARPFTFAAYYTWYHNGEHPKRPWHYWTYPSAATNALAIQARRPGEPAPASAARPLAGLYDSADPAIAEWHVQLAKAAGIDAFLVDWWDTHNGLDENFEKGILAAAEKQGFKIALLDERAQYHDTLENYERMLTRALRKYKESKAYLRIDGRPAVYLYQVASEPGLSAAEFSRLKKQVESEVGPVYWIVDKIAHDAKAARDGDEDRTKRIPADWLAMPGIDSFGFYGAFSNFRAHRHEDVAGKYRYLTKLAHDAGKKMLLPVHPGHDNSHFRSDPYVMPRREGETLRDYLRAATEAGADYILVTSWNEWPETTVVEPSSSWPDPWHYLKILAEWKGVQFTPARLPGERRNVRGWRLEISRALLESERTLTERAVELLRQQLEEILRVVPGAAVAELQKVPLYFSPEYAGVKPRAEFHPGAGWLRENGRDPAMAGGIEFTDIRNFESEMKRMPNFTLHELAHAYHHRVLAGGFGNAEIRAAFEKAKAAGNYERVERWFGNGRPNRQERAYAMTSQMEYFAEASEAYFSRNDFFPFTREELKQHDPEMFALVEKLWNHPAEP